MSGNTGYTGVTNDNPFTPPANITAVYEHFDPLIDPSVATSADLPASGNWVGRHFFVVDIHAFRVWDGSVWFDGGAIGTAVLDTANWAAPSTMSLFSKSGFAFFRFNGQASTNRGVGAKIVDIPTGFRTNANVWNVAWWLGTVNGVLQVYYDAAVNEVKINSGINAGQSVAISMMWPITG